MLNEVNNSVFLEGESPALNYLKNALNEETQIFRLPQFYIYYVLEMEKCQSFNIQETCRKIVILRIHQYTV